MSAIDDRDPGIEYSGNWSHGGVATEHLNTTTYTRVAGDTATYKFTGSSIVVYGTIPPTSEGVTPVSNYTIDSGEPLQYISPLQATWQHQQVFFTRSNLELTQHTLVITNIVDNDFLYLDYFLVGTSASTPTTSSATSRTSTTSSPIPTTSTPSPSSTTGTATATGTEKQTSSLVGATVGGAIAGVAIIALMFCACFFFWRRRPQNKIHPQPPPAFHAETYPTLRRRQTNVTPFIMGASDSNFGSDSTAAYGDEYGSILGAGEVVVPSHKVPLPVGARRKHSDLPPGYTSATSSLVLSGQVLSSVVSSDGTR